MVELTEQFKQNINFQNQQWFTNHFYEVGTKRQKGKAEKQLTKVIE